MIDLERIERKERKKGADPPDHPRAKGSRRTRDLDRRPIPPPWRRVVPGAGARYKS